jgi:hypothetical protein
MTQTSEPSDTRDAAATGGRHRIERYDPIEIEPRWRGTRGMLDSRLQHVGL